MRRASIPLGRLALLLAATAGPWCEAGAGARAREHLALRTDAQFDAWDVDVSGLHLHGVRAAVRGLALWADEIVVTADGDGLDIRILGASAATGDSPAAATTATAPVAVTESPPARDRFRIANAGVPIRIHAVGTVRVPVGDGLEAAIEDPRVEIDRDGWPTLHADIALHGLMPEPLRVDGLVARRGLGVWTATADATAPGGDTLAIALRLGRKTATATATAADGGTLGVTKTTGDPTVRVEAAQFALGHAGPWLAGLVADHGVTATDATLSGVIEVTRGDSLRVHAEDLVLGGIVVSHPRLSARPVRIDGVAIDGDAVWHGGRAELQLVVGHGDARMAIGGHVDRDAIALDLDVAEMPCDGLLEAMPAGTADALVGLRLDGTIAAGIHLEVSLAEIERARARGDEFAPGELSFEFPFLERCRTLADPANVDLAALRGPYRHRFGDDGGGVRERVLAPGAPGFAPLGRVPKLASAFIALEDMRFWYHDGFDREQIERAFWHNVVRGRVRRGASTISQQTARNLWLGVDRSIARKLQEAYLTTRLETEVSKTRILELYVNLVELGPGVYGVDAAAEFYFGKPATELDVLQAVHIASLAPAPVTYAERFADGQVNAAWMDELRGHVRRMHRNRMIRDADAHTALRGELELLDRTRG